MTQSFDLTLVTCDAFIELTPDDLLFHEALIQRGLQIRVVSWRDQTVDWSASRLTLIRSTWDYFEQPDAFSQWINQVAPLTRLINPAAMLRWNMHKRYLAEMEEKGCLIVPTLFVDQHQHIDLLALCAERSWQEIIVKPCVSAGSFNTQRFAGSSITTAAQAHLEQITRCCDAMIQPYLPAVDVERERSLIFFDGVFSHAALRRTFNKDGSGDQRIEEAYSASPQEIAMAKDILATLDDRPAYARVDLIPYESGFALMELELIEPALFFRFGPGSAERFADSLAALLQ